MEVYTQKKARAPHGDRFYLTPPASWLQALPARLVFYYERIGENMLGGGTFLTHNKVLPGSYINFASAQKASAQLSDRGIAALALDLDWGPDAQIFTIHASSFASDAQAIFGYPASHAKLKGIRDLLRGARTAYLYRLNSGEKAKNTYAQAKYSGIRGNDLSIIIQKNAGDQSKWDVSTALDGRKLETQTVASVADLKPNDYVTFLPEATLAETAGSALTGGSNASSVEAEQYQDFLDLLECYSFNTLGCLSDDPEITQLVSDYTKRMRDEVGAKFQAVLYQQASDYEGVINLDTPAEELETGLIYWVTGIQSGCNINQSATNKLYDGEFTPLASYTQAQLEDGIRSGKLMLHKVGDDVRLLQDINSLVSFSEDKGQDFSDNQTIRVLDQIANDIASLFNTKYLGKIPNDASGRMSLWNDIVAHHKSLQDLRAIENFKAEDVTVEAGDSKKAIVVNDVITVTNAMAQLYMTVIVQ